MHTPFSSDKVQGIIFDYGATIDSDGKHWAEVIWEGYVLTKSGVSKADFRTAYVFAERAMAKSLIILPNDNFFVLMQKKVALQAEQLATMGYMLTPEQSAAIVDYCYQYAARCVTKAKPILEALYKRYPLVLVSNFYGNIHAVLKDFSIDHLFQHIFESAVVGIRKPDPAIFQLGVDCFHLPASHVVVIGDSYRKDIAPAQSIGAQAIWIKGVGWDDNEDLIDYQPTISTFSQLTELLS